MSNKQKNRKNKIRAKSELDESLQSAAFKEFILDLALHLTVLVEACGSLLQAERYGLLKDLSDDQYDLAFAMVPVELGGDATGADGQAMWNLIRPAAMQDPALLSDIQQFRYWIATGQISENLYIAPVTTPNHVLNMPALPWSKPPGELIVDYGDRQAKDDEVLFPQQRSKE